MQKATKNMLSAKMSFQLMSMVKESYVEAGITDTEFAKKAENILQFPVTESNVASARKALEIPATRTARIGASDSSIVSRIASLESRVSALEYTAWKKS